MQNQLDHDVAQAILGVDTLWGGDVMNPSGTGRFIADSWYSDEPLPEAYTHPLAAKLRESGGVSAKEIDRQTIRGYLAAVDVEAAIAEVGRAALRLGAGRGAFLLGLADSCRVMFEMAIESMGDGGKVPYSRAVRASTGRHPAPSHPEHDRNEVTQILASTGHLGKAKGDLLAAVDLWRQERAVAGRDVARKSSTVIAGLEQLSRKNLLPYLPQEIHETPLANIEFLSIENAWFSGSMNYIGRARDAGGAPRYEATYEINASLQISTPEFEQLVSHEVVPGHGTTFAFLQRLHGLGRIGFEGTVLTMNTRFATLAEGIANNAILIAHGVKSVDQLEDANLRVGVLLALLQDQAKNQSSWLTWAEGWPKEEVAKVLRRDYLVSEERADKLSGAWGRHPLLGRMYLPAYHVGTQLVEQLRIKHAPEKILPVLYGCAGLVDVVTIADHV